MVVGLWREVTELRQENTRLRERVRELEEQRQTNSHNSSKPPSSDPPWATRKPGKPGDKQRRKAGGQPGHKGHRRELVPPEQVDEILEVRPEPQCPCGGRVIPSMSPPERRQVFELPRMRPHVTELRIFGGRCCDCGRVHRAIPPRGTPAGMLGPRAMAMASWLVGTCHVSRRMVQEVFAEFFGLSMSLGAVSSSEERVSEAIEAPVEAVAEAVKADPAVHMDETGLRQAGKRHWLWVLVGTALTLFRIRASRGAEVAKEMLGDGTTAIVVSDRWSGYGWLATMLRQLCWAHLIRDFTKISERAREAGKVGKALLGLARELFELWHDFGDGKFERAELQKRSQPIRARLLAELKVGTRCGHPKTQRTCVNILALAPALWTFIDREGVEPTNNTAERAIRPAVLWRKCSFGPRADRGARFAERILTVAATCRQQGRNVIDYLMDAVDAHLRGEATPSLLPVVSKSARPAA